MPRNALLSRSNHSTLSDTPPAPVPTIRFISATPSTHEPSESQIELNMDALPLPSARVAPFAPPTRLAPKADAVASPRRKLVPKKSKLALLGAVKDKARSRGRADDLSDVVRRVGADTGSARGGVEIFVDHCADADDASIVMVRKTRARAPLENVQWAGNAGGAPLAERTNTNAPARSADKDKENKGVMLRIPTRGDENQGSRWWNVSIGRGRKALKEKDHAPIRSKTPEPFGTPAADPEPRARFNSLDSSRLLSVAQPQQAERPPQVPPKDTQAPVPAPQAPRQRSGTLSSLSTLSTFSSVLTAPSSDSGTESLLTPPPPPETTHGQGSIALRAMKSMRSIARMKSWANLGGKEGNTDTNGTTATIKPKSKKKTKEKRKGDTIAARSPASSFEACRPSTLEVPVPPLPAGINKKPSMLSLGGLIPGSLRLGTVRSTSSRVSSSSSRAGTPITSNPPTTNGLYALANARLSMLDSTAHLPIAPQGRPSSAYSHSSAGSSLRPPSTASGGSVSAYSTRSPRSSTSSVSVRWDEECLQGTRDRQRRERQERRNVPGGKDSRRSADGRRRTPVIDIFPEIRDVAKRNCLQSTASIEERQPPAVTVEVPTSDGHSEDNAPADGTPVKRPRPRPVSEQLLGKMRPKAIMDDADGVLSILDAATNDLASLINRLDLEATPASIKGSPSLISLRRGSEDSPLKTKKCTFNKDHDAPLLAERDSFASLRSLRPYGQITRAHSSPAAPASRQQAMDPAEARRMLIGQQIAPWHELNWQVSPKQKAAAQDTVKAFRPSHRRTVTPAPEEMGASAAFQPLKPAAQQRASSVEQLPSAASTPAQAPPMPAVPSSQTFGSEVVSKTGKTLSADLGYDDAAPPSPTPTARRRPKHVDRTSVLSVICDTGATLSRDSLMSLGLAADLQDIMSGQSDEEADDDEDTESFDKMMTFTRRNRAPSPGLPPFAALPDPEDETEARERTPVFRATLLDEDDNEAEIDEGDGSGTDEDDTKKSFDFTGELRLLNQSGASDRLSFVEQLENAFRTPADISYGLKLGPDLFRQEEPRLPALRLEHRETPDKDNVPETATESELSSFELEYSDEQSYRLSTESDTIDHLLAECEEELCRPYSVKSSRSTMRSKESDGKLNRSFKFGGKPSIPDSLDESMEERPLTLSDIIPPVSHSRSPSQSSLLESDSSVLKSILGRVYEDDTSVVDSIVARAQAAAKLEARARVNSTASSNRGARDSLNLSTISSHSRNSSELSFKGFESFEEVRRGFEFHPNRPAFYPPPGAPKPWHNRYDSSFSFASVSSYGAVMNAGAPDPFGYASSRPVSTGDDMSFAMSTTVDDTFSFLKKDQQRQRVDSDASSFYFRPGVARGHRRNDSNFSVRTSYPPISIYNRNGGGHRRNDSNASTNSVAQPYARTAGNRSSWARHRQQPSGDSLFSGDFSMSGSARPGLGDKMFDRMDYGMPLPSITASPTGSAFSDQDACKRYSDISEPYGDRGMPYDSIFDAEQGTGVTDSIFGKTGVPTSYEASDDVFEFDLSQPSHLTFSRLNQFRPISMMSVTSTHSIARDEDTMITMLGGGHVRRRSVDSRIDDSPCIDLARKERKKHTALQHLARVLQYDQGPDELPSNVVDRFSKFSPEKAVIPKPSIASTSSYQFGAERMIKAGRGLLERQSLEESALMAQGEEIIASLETTTVFSRPGPARRARSNTVSSSGGETPPLSASDSSSISSGSQSSIDIGQLNNLLTAPTIPSSGIARSRTMRMRARGAGHRRRMSSVRMSRSSVYETIEEECGVYCSSPSPAHSSTNLTVDYNMTALKDGSLPQTDSVYIVDPDSGSVSDWDDERGIMTMRRYYALKDEVEVTVTESRKMWSDTPFSTFALQAFEPPRTRTGMQAMLEHSQKSYGPLSSELLVHRVRSRTSSRAVPYPVRPRRISTSSQEQQPCPPPQSKPFASPCVPAPAPAPLRDVSINPNVPVFSLPPSLKAMPSPATKAAAQGKDANGLPRPRVTSSTRRAALGWSKRNNTKASSGTAKSSTGTSKSSTSTAHAKENAGTITSPNASLRISRPRPRGRASNARPALDRAPLAAM